MIVNLIEVASLMAHLVLELYNSHSVLVLLLGRKYMYLIECKVKELS